MISHAITVISKAVEYVNPGQTVVIACDQPLFALAKTIQWAQNDSAGEGNLVVMLGGLHIEQAALKAIGTWLAGSGRGEVLSQAEITTAGRAESLVNCAHITGTKYAHQVTAASLFILQKQAYRKYVESVKEGEEADSFSTWRSKKETMIPRLSTGTSLYNLSCLYCPSCDLSESRASPCTPRHWWELLLGCSHSTARTTQGGFPSGIC